MEDCCAYVLTEVIKIWEQCCKTHVRKGTVALAKQYPEIKFLELEKLQLNT